MNIKTKRIVTLLDPSFVAMFQILSIAAVSAVVLWPILPSAFSADDTFDSFIPFQLHYSGQSIWSLINGINESWRISQGRFFPVAIGIGALSHYYFPERASYKALQFSVAIIAIMLFYYFVKLITRNNGIAILSCLVALGSTQIRVQYDPVLQFSLQQPALIIFLLLTFSFFVNGIRRSNNFFIAASGLFYMCALTTYETAVLLWPIFPLLLIAESPKKWKCKLASTAVAPLVITLNLLYLRNNVTATAPGYTSNFNIETVSKTFFKQSVSSLPMSFTEINTPPYVLNFPQHLQFGDWNWWLAIILTAILVVSALRVLRVPPLRVQISLVLIGLVLWLAPALVVAQTVRWQNEIVLGNGYITAYQGYFGFSLVFVGLICILYSRWRVKTKLLFRLFSSLILALTIVSISSVVSNNPRAVAQYNAGYLWPRDHFERAVSAGVFNNLRSNTTVLTPQGEWWFNAPFINWYGGPRIKNLISSRNVSEFTSCLEEVGTCQRRFGISHTFVVYGRFPDEPRVTLVGRVQSLSGSNGQLQKIEVDQASFYIDYPKQSINIADSRLRCSTWLYGRLRVMGLQIGPEEVEVKKAGVGHCLVQLSPEILIDSLVFTP